MPSSNDTPDTPTLARARTWTLLIVDDHPIVRRGIRDALSEDGRLEIVGDAPDAAPDAQ